VHLAHDPDVSKYSYERHELQFVLLGTENVAPLQTPAQFPLEVFLTEMFPTTLKNPRLHKSQLVLASTLFEYRPATQWVHLVAPFPEVICPGGQLWHALASSDIPVPTPYVPSMHFLHLFSFRAVW
jgi:hypothetical protein